MLFVRVPTNRNPADEHHAARQSGGNPTLTSFCPMNFGQQVALGMATPVGGVYVDIRRYPVTIPAG